MRRFCVYQLVGMFLLPSLAQAQAAKEFGIDRSNLTRESEAVQEKTLHDIHALHATWFRDVLITAPQPISEFVNEVKLAKQNDLKFLANVLPAKADFDEGYHTPNAGEAFRKRCGWSQGSSQLSRLDAAKFAQHFRMQLDAVKAANLTIDAFEIGNEDDWICFNGDVPDGHTPTDAEWMTAVRGYADFLKAAAEVIRDPYYFPNAKIITFGIAHGSDRWDHPPHHFSNPARMVAMLRNLDGFNYLDNSTYHVDGYGTHIYPDPDNLEQSVTDLVRQDATILGPDKPFWITEWGLSANRYPNKQGQTRGEAIRNFYAVLDKLHIPFGPPFYYAYNLLIDAKGTLLPEASAVAPIDARNSQSNTSSCMECIRIRVGLPRIVRGPGSGIPDNPLTEIQLPNGRFRGFSASSTTYAIDGATPSDMGGTAVPVLPPRARSKYGESGEWINHVERSHKTVLAWVHDETGDRQGMGLKSMSLAVSDNDGMSWRSLGQIITGTDALTPGRITGEGDCTAVDGGDGYYYAYCGRNTNPGTIVARAPVANPGPGNWKKYFEGEWSHPGLGGDATTLARGIGTTTARWLTTGETLNLGWVPGQEGLRLYFSRDYVHFTALPEPLLVVDPYVSWSHRLQEPHELMASWSLLDANTGANQLGDHWLLFYMDLQPHESFDKRYQVFRPVEISRSRKPGEPQVGVMLAHWYNAKLHDHWSTVAPVPGNYSEYKLEAKSGYLMTAADPKRPSVELEDCVSQGPGHPDHILIQKGVCESHGYKRLRTAGWVFSSPQPGTQPLYRCYSEAEKSHFAANSESCDHAGKMEALLGYDLKE